MVKEPSSAFKLVFLSCQTPVPFGLHVGFFSVSGVAAVTFFQAFLLGLVPLSLLSLYIGDAAAMADQGLQGNTSGLEAASFWIGLLASIGFVAYIVWHGRSVLESIETSDGGEGQLLVDKPEEQAALAP